MKRENLSDLKTQLKQFQEAEVFLDRQGKFDDPTRKLFNSMKDKLIGKIERLSQKRK
jgi:hypothetical protein